MAQLAVKDTDRGYMTDPDFPYASYRHRIGSMVIATISTTTIYREREKLEADENRTPWLNECTIQARLM